MRNSQYFDIDTNVYDQSHYSVYSRKGGVDPHFHTFVLWASDWGWIEQTLNSRRSPPEIEVTLLLLYDKKYVNSQQLYIPP